MKVVLSTQLAGHHPEQFIQSVDVYIRWYNEKRIKVSLGSLSPIQYRKSLGFTA
jgi:putative transposase